MGTFLFAFLFSFLIVTSTIWFFVFQYPERNPRISQYKIITNGEKYRVKYRGRIVDYDSYDSFKKAKKAMEEHYNKELSNWERKNSKWVSITTEREIKRYAKKHPELLEEL